MTAVSATTVDMTNQTLLNFHRQRESAYVQTKDQINTNFLPYQKKVEALDAFAKAVRHAGHQLQNQEVPVPPKQQLESQKDSLLIQYQQFKGTYEKIKEFAENIKRTIDFIRPVARSYEDEKSFKTRSPKLHEETMRSEEICLGYVRELTASHQSIVDLQNRMFTTLTGNTELSWSLQRFCAIVENDGKPLSLYQRTLNYVLPAVVPKSNTPQLDNSIIVPPNSFGNTSDSKPKQETKTPAAISKPPENPVQMTPPTPLNNLSNPSEAKPKQPKIETTAPATISKSPDPALITPPVLPLFSDPKTKVEPAAPATVIKSIENLSLITPPALPNNPPHASDSTPKKETIAPPNAINPPENPSLIIPPALPNNPPHTSDAKPKNETLSPANPTKPAGNLPVPKEVTKQQPAKK